MDIKWKNIRYSRSSKIAAAIIVWLCVMTVLGNVWFISVNYQYIASKSYYDTHEFKDSIYRLVHNIVELKVILKDEETIKGSGQSEKAIINNLGRLEQIKNNLSNTVNFVYLIKNSGSGDTITNAPSGNAQDLIMKQPYFVHLNQYSAKPDFHYLQEDIRRMLSGTSYEVYAAVTAPLKNGDEFYDGYIFYSRIKQILPYSVSILIGSVILMLAAFIYLISVTGRMEKGGKVVLSPVDRIYNDIHTLLVFIAAVISVINLVHSHNYSFTESLIFVSVILTLDIFIGLSYVLSMARQIKAGRILDNTLIFKILIFIKSFVRSCFRGRVFKAWTLLLLLCYGAANSIMFAAAVNNGRRRFAVIAILQILFNAAAIYFCANSLLSLTRIMEAAKEISSGNLDYNLDSSNISISFSSFAEDIRSIQGGLKKAVDEAVRGERMKTDLITNVSHDLKTPLTSIVNYVDLLKKEGLNNQKANEYVGILEEKSARLKQLIEDLVEASKASSGNLAVRREKIDLHELIIQACGEYEEKILKSELDIRISTSEEQILILADGKHMWRIIENLMSNVLKYSMPHSRVYINIGRNDTLGFLTIKNISAFPLNISPDQLTERFVRGDVSRATEGSGLGLSIAQSLASLQGGRFNIDIDGDLFKTTIEMPLWLEK